jgi:hypothetical protein
MLTRLLMFAALIIAMTVLDPVALHAQGVITVRLSYKIIRNPADGTLPTKSDGTQVSDNDIDADIAVMNSLSAAYARGFYFQRVDEVAYIGDKDDKTGPSKYFGINFLTDPKSGELKDQMEDAALKDAAYAWNSGAINIYLNQNTGGGKCSFPSDGKSIIVIGPGAIFNSGAAVGSTTLHEIGHFFNLSHTHTDDVTDTLNDSPYWTQDQIASNNFGGKTYNQLSAGQQQQVDDTILNLMSYHGTTGGSAVPAGTTFQSRLTELQLDRWTEAANGPRRGVCDGTTVFAQVSTNYGAGSSTAPYGSVVVATQVASNRPGNNIVMFRPGITTEAITVNPPAGTTVTLRATRQGTITIGK